MKAVSRVRFHLLALSLRVYLFHWPMEWVDLKLRWMNQKLDLSAHGNKDVLERHMLIVAAGCIDYATKRH